MLETELVSLKAGEKSWKVKLLVRQHGILLMSVLRIELEQMVRLDPGVGLSFC